MNVTSTCISYINAPEVRKEINALVNAMNNEEQAVKINRMPTKVLESKRLCSGGEHWATSGIASFKTEKLNEVIIINVCLSIFSRKGHRNREILPKTSVIFKCLL